MTEQFEHRGTCGKCLYRCTYVVYPNRAYWVHDDTGHFIRHLPETHDCNTYIIPD